MISFIKINNTILKNTFSTIKNQLESIINQQFHPVFYQIKNESHKHTRGLQTHFNIYIVSEQFKQLSKIQKHKLVYHKLGQMMGKIHALTLTCHSPSQWQQNNKNQSPQCIHNKNNQ